MLRHALLGVVFATVALIAVWVEQETSWDKDWPSRGQISRIMVPSGADGHGVGAQLAAVETGLVFSLMQRVPDVDFTRSVIFHGHVLSTNSPVVQSRVVLAADQSFIEVFEPSCVVGNCSEALLSGVLITQPAAVSMFGRVDVTQERITVQGFGEFVILGVIDVPDQRSHLPFEVLIPNALTSSAWPQSLFEVDPRYQSLSFLYARTDDTGEARMLDSALSELSTERAEMSFAPPLHAVPIDDIHLHATRSDDLVEPGSQFMVSAALGMAITTFLVAVVQLLLHTVTDLFSRSREFGVLEGIGYSPLRICGLVARLKSNVILVFVGAYSLTFLIGGVTIAGLQAHMAAAVWTVSIAALLALLVAVFLLTCFYIVHDTTPFAKVTARGTIRRVRQLNNGIAHIVISVSAAALVGVALNAQEFQTRTRTNLGFDAQGLFVGAIWSGPSQIEAIESSLPEPVRRTAIAASSLYPMQASLSENPITVNRLNGPTLELSVASHSVSGNFPAILGARILGQMQNWNTRWALVSQDTDTIPVMINSALARRISLTTEPDYEELLGLEVHRVFFEGRSVTGEIVAIVDDFKFESVNGPVRPLLLTPPTSHSVYALVRPAGDEPDISGLLEQEIAQIIGESSLGLESVTQRVIANARDLKLTGLAFSIAAVIAVFLASLGLVRASSDAAATYRREFAIRLVVGQRTNRTIAVGVLRASWKLILSITISTALTALVLPRLVPDWETSISGVLIAATMCGIVSSLFIQLMYLTYFARLRSKSLTSILTTGS